MTTSAQLQAAQTTLENLAKMEIDAPMTNYRKLSRLLKVIGEVDTTRRELWNDEKFGESDAAANVIYDSSFVADDIPF